MNFTCLTLSKKPFQRELLPDCAYINQVQTFTSKYTLHKARLDSIKKVTTPYFFVCDTDDPMPTELITPDKGIIYGDNYIVENGIERVIKTGEWTSRKHIYYPQFIHKPICNTEIAKEVINLLPDGDYYTDHILYYCLAQCGGFTYDERLVIKWNKFKTGQHKRKTSDILNSINWLLVNQKRLELIKLRIS